MSFRINIERLMARLDKMAEIGRIPGGGVHRLALTDEDREARDLLARWMHEEGLHVMVDPIGNMFGKRQGTEDLPPVMSGSHLDTVAMGGRFDGSLGVLAALEVASVLNENDVQTRNPYAVVNFTNEEGARFTPDIMGSLVYSGQARAEDIYPNKEVEGKATVGEELDRTGYKGSDEFPKPRAFIEVHIEQGPVLETEEINAGAVEMVQGISWTEIVLTGQANHAGTTPVHLRKDAGLVAARIIDYARNLTGDLDGNPVATAGWMTWEPNVYNVIPGKVRFSLDMRNTNNEALKEAEERCEEFARKAAGDEGVDIEVNRLVRFLPVKFDAGIVDLITETGDELGLSVKRMPSGAGHDAQMMAHITPTAMIFIPSVGGISHDRKEFSEKEDIENGANLLLNSLLKLLE